MASRRSMIDANVSRKRDSQESRFFVLAIHRPAARNAAS